MSSKQGVELRTLIVTALGLSIPIWDIAFKLGAYKTVFYDKLFNLWVAASVVLLINQLLPKNERYLSRWGKIALFNPTIWLATNALIPNIEQAWFDDVVWIIALITFTIAVPYILYLLFSLVESDALSLSPRYLKILIGALLFVSLAGYAVGAFNSYFVSCQMFSEAGDNPPANCEVWD